MNFIFTNQVTNYLLIDIINAFAENGDECKLLAGEVMTGNVPLNKKVTVVPMIKYDRNTGMKRIYTWASYTLQLFFKLLVSKKGAELFIVTNPPTAPFIGYFLKWLKGVKYHLLVYDVYPDALVQFGKAERGGTIERKWGAWNKKIFQYASTIYTLSNAMAGLIKKYNAGVQVEVIANWADTAFIKPIEKIKNQFAITHGQTDKITVMYSGNMGATHAVEKIGELAGVFKEDTGFGFMLIGDGAKKQLLEQMKKEEQLDNLLIQPYQTTEVLPYSLTTADIAIVTLSAGAEELSVPSKTYNMLAAGAALLVIASERSELAELAKKYDCGVAFEENDVEGMTTFLRQMKEQPERLQQLKNNARNASQYFTPENAKKYVGLLNSNAGVS